MVEIIVEKTYVIKGLTEGDISVLLQVLMGKEDVNSTIKDLRMRIQRAYDDTRDYQD